MGQKMAWFRYPPEIADEIKSAGRAAEPGLFAAFDA
jgi:hypothetical protein